MQHGDYAYTIDLQDGNLHITIVKHHHLFYDFYLAQYAILVEGVTFWAGHSP